MAVNEDIYLVLSRQKVERMTKRIPSVYKGEIIVKVRVKADSSAFREPTLVREIVVTDPFDGMAPADVEFSQPFITEAEAQQIRETRRQRLVEDLMALGYKIEPPEETCEQPGDS